MMKKIYLNIDWMSRSVSVSDKEGFEDWKKYLVEENKCGKNRDGNSLEIYNEDDEDEGDSMVELKIEEKDLY